MEIVQKAVEVQSSRGESSRPSAVSWLGLGASCSVQPHPSQIQWSLRPEGGASHHVHARFVLGKGLDRDKLNTCCMTAQWHSCSRPTSACSTRRRTRSAGSSLEFVFAEPIQPVVAVNNSVLSGRSMNAVLLIPECIVGQPLAPRVDGLPVSLAFGPSPDWFMQAT
jgi:hypothetical protein